MMNRLFFGWATSLTILLSIGLFFNSCKKDDSTSGTSGNARLEITDGPVDDANVKAVFITVADVKIDGKSWSGFKGKTTFDLLAYQKGDTKLLGDGSLDAKSYGNIVLVLDTETDAGGNSPGCYVQDAQNLKQKLEGGASKSITIAGNFVASAASTANLVLDFDLRKTIAYQSGATTKYTFATDAELSAGIRLIEKSKTGTVKGNCVDVISGSEKIVVYAYKKGSYNVNTEKTAQGASLIQFKNASGSAVVGSDASFQIAFLENGDYELHFISYKDSNNDGKLDLKGELQLSTTSSLDLLNFALGVAATVNVNVLVTGIILF